MGLLGRLFGSPRDRFAAEALRITRQVPGVHRVRYDAAKFAVAAWREGTTAPVWIYLSNVFAECEGSAAPARRARITQLVRIILTPHDDETWEQVRPRLRPVLRAATFGQGGPMGMVPPLSRAALPHLRELVVVDRPESMAYVTPPRLDEWKVSADEVFTAARENLQRIAERSLSRNWPDAGALIRMVDTGDGYFTSLLLAPGWLAGIGDAMDAQVVAFVPDVNTVLLCPVGEGGMPGLFSLIENEFNEAARAVSPVGYVADERGRVTAYAPPPGHPDHVPARRAAVVLAHNEYGAQTRWLSTQYAEHGIDVFVASLIAAARPDEPAITVTTWTDGITSLLPEADFISFVRDGEAWGRVPWRDVAKLVDLEPEPLLAPTRYRVTDWPPAETMSQLRAHAVD
ncbi:hypothetical protein Cme02nite_07830 [Catellatospora methionotrophica]|uniref:Uncharacterized protein n=1 Tax=Catellatospora methionotrophica TaxID=121620 RepID=A0A8J3PCH7_9ACTN|nr:hypothetical protein [Catellatospora methionotrophica]GIG12451.1 hypothetical protein Cme02nite_07830 [Catellatospora methionotrophica]